MRKNILTIILVFVSAISFAQDNIGRSAWVASPVKIDGFAEEWKQPLRYYDSNTKLFFAFANDEKNLYLCFQTPDQLNQTKIMRAGMKITVSSKGKDKHKLSISFPLEQKAEPGNDNKGQQKNNKWNDKNSFLVQNTMMEVKGFASRNGMIPINDSSGINAAINWDDANKFTYEVAIPLKELFGSNYSAEDISSDISLNAEVHAMAKSGGGGGGEHGYSGRSGGGGGRMGGGGMHRGERSSNDNQTNLEQLDPDRTAMFEKAELKEKFVLAPKQ